MLLMLIESLTDLVDAVITFTKGALEKVQFLIEILLVKDVFDSVS
jgi:hypothetical protein